MQVYRYANIKRPSNSPITNVTFSPDGSLVASGSGQVELWDAVNGEKRSRFKGHERAVTAVAFLPDGKTLVSADYYGFRFWNVEDNKQESEVHIGGWIPCMAISPDGKLLAFGGAILHIRNMNLEQFWDHAFPGDCWSISFSPVGKTLACSSDSTIQVCTVDPFTINQELEGWRSACKWDPLRGRDRRGKWTHRRKLRMVQGWTLYLRREGCLRWTIMHGSGRPVATA